MELRQTYPCKEYLIKRQALYQLVQLNTDEHLESKGSAGRSTCVKGARQALIRLPAQQVRQPQNPSYHPVSEKLKIK
jgi:hypothetical protein